MESKIDIDNICRLCMHSPDENLESLFDLTENIPSQIMAFSTVEICVGDGLPSKICKLCIGEVKKFTQFKIIVEQNDLQMRSLLNKPRKRPKVEQEVDDDYEVNIKSEVVLEDLNHDPLNQMWKELNADDEKDSSSPEDNDNDGEEDNDNGSSDEDPTIEGEIAEPKGRLKGIDSYSINEDGKYECKLCDKKLADKKGIKLHLRLHTGEKLKICKICDRGFLKPHHLLRHLETHNRKCEECDKKFLSISDYRNHVKEVHPVAKRPKPKKIKKEVTTPVPQPLPDSKDIVCKICDVSFKHIYKLRAHLNDHLDVNSFADIDLNTKEYLFEPTQTSDLVNQPKENLINYITNEIATGDKLRLYTIYKRSTGYEMHLTDSETESESEATTESLSDGKGVQRQHQCSLCHSLFDRIEKIMDHLTDSHPEDSGFKDRCEFCQKVFPNAFTLQRHVAGQCGNQKKTYKCDTCNLKFMWEQNLRLHYEQCGPSIESIKTRYRKTETGELVCELCQKTFLRKEYLMRHMMTHVPNERKFECPECHKKFNRKDNLRSHLKTHSKDQDMPVPEGQLCVYCGRNFSNSSNLIVHMRRHTGEKPYKCEFCDKGFPRSSDLQCHRRTHTGEKPCLCTICGKGFSRSNKLVRHMRIHTGVRPYQCNHCDRAFTQSNDLTLHVRRHTGERPYVCGVCGDRFIQGTALKAHQKAQQHFDDAKKESPFASISVNNPNRFSNINHVARVNDGAPLPIKAVRSKSQKNAKVNSSPVKQETQMSIDGTNAGDRSDHSEISAVVHPMSSGSSGPNNFSVPFAIGLPNMGEQLSTLFTISQHYNQSHYGHNQGNQNN